ncbi:MAG: hypothetical protein LBH19_02965 [Dysgonamonadaceae bacterium]|jgi:hypothetical protein|nr:hypothetical protein [Dysgonamonadaceae bacterium]
MTTLSVNSPILVITSGNVPTTTTLQKGEFAYGTIGGKLRYFGNTGSAIVELTAKEYAALTNGGLTINANGQISIINGGVVEAMLASALQTKINNVLLKNNTVAFTPTADYHPSTKKYVDDVFSNAMAVANGRTKAIVFDTQAQLNQWLAGSYNHPSGLVKNDLSIGDVLFIKAIDVSDYWWDGTAIRELESRIDLSNYWNITQTQAVINELIGNINFILDALNGEVI